MDTFLDSLLLQTNSTQSSFSKKIEKILDTKPHLSSFDIYSLIIDLVSFFSTDNFSENEKRITYIKKIIDLYDDDLNDDHKFYILLYLNDDKLFEEYAHKHYKLFQEKLKNIVFIEYYYNDSIELFDFQDELDYLGYPYQAEWATFDFKTYYLLYTFFGDDLKFFKNHKIRRYFLRQFNGLSHNQKLSILCDVLKKELSLQDFNDIVNFFFTYNEEVADLTILLQAVDTQKQMQSILEMLSSLYFSLPIHFSYPFSYLYNKVFRLKVEEFDFKEENTDNLFSILYLKSLNQLEKMSLPDRKKDSLYLSCFQTFLKTFLINYSDFVDESDLYVLELLFQRVIHHKNIFDILAINNKKSLYHYYKTDRLVSSIDFSLDMVKRYNAKQYLKLRDLYEATFSKHNVNLNDYGLDVLFLIPSLEFFGYSWTEKVIKMKVDCLADLVSRVKDKGEDYIQQLKPVFMDVLPVLNAKQEYSYELFFVCFDMLYKNQYRKITADKVKKCMDSIAYLLFPNNYHIADNLELLNFVPKGRPLDDKIEGIKLYDQYRFRLLSSIPDISGSIGDCFFSMVDIHSSEILSNGIGHYILPNTIASSCLTPNGTAASCLRHGALNPNGRFFKVVCQDNILAYSWVWRCGDVLCFDNIEVTKELLDIPNYEEVVYMSYKQAAEEIMRITNKEENGGVKLVTIGKNPIDVSNCYLEKLPLVNDYTNKLFQPNSSEKLRLVDSSSKQIILAGKYQDSLSTEDVVPIYKYQRKPVKRFCDFDKIQLEKEMNAIYFDYCIDNNKKYTPILNSYSDGYINEDWFVGIKKDSFYDFYYRGKDDRLFLEANQVIDSNISLEKTAPSIILPSDEKIQRILDVKNIEVDISGLEEYLEQIPSNTFQLADDCYIHNPASIKNLSNILLNGAITSSMYGNHSGGSGCNGPHFISVAKVNTDAYNSYVSSKAIILTDDICAFQGQGNVAASFSDSFMKSAYPYRKTNFDGEFHVLNHILLDKANGIFSSNRELTEMVQIVYLQELFDNSLPLVLFENKGIVDKSEVKRYSKIIHK